MSTGKGTRESDYQVGYEVLEATQKIKSRAAENATYFPVNNATFISAWSRCSTLTRQAS